MPWAVSHHGFRYLPLYIIIVVFVIGAVFRLSLYNVPLQTTVSTATSLKNMGPTRRARNSLSMEAACMREVLKALRLPLSRIDYSLQSLEHPLDLTLLSSSCQSFLIPPKVSNERKKKLKCFLPDPSVLDFRYIHKDRVRRVLHLIHDYFERAHIPIAMTDGTALGSWRMHGQIPYDHDVDFFALTDQMSRTTELMKKMESIHPELLKTYNWTEILWRFELKHQDGSKLMLIHVFFHKLRNTGTAMEQFLQRPFEGILFKTWRNMKQFIGHQYGRTGVITCKPTPWIRNHYKDECVTTVVNCSELNYFFNFTRRWEHEDGRLVEVLFNRSHALSVFYSPDGV